MKVIEFIGIPGSGKSTVSRLVLSGRMKVSSLEVLSYQHILASPEKQRRGGRLLVMLRCLKFILLDSPTFLLLVIASFRPIERSRWRSFRALRLAELSRRFRGIAYRSREVVLDQGPLQALLSWMWTGGEMKLSTAKRIFESIYPEGVELTVVLLETNAKVAMSRIMERENLGQTAVLGDLTDEERLSALERGTKCLEWLLSALEGTGFTVIRLDGTSLPSDNAQHILKIVGVSIKSHPEKCDLP